MRCDRENLSSPQCPSGILLSKAIGTMFKFSKFQPCFLHRPVTCASRFVSPDDVNIILCQKGQCLPINCVIWWSPSTGLLLDAVPGQGAPGGGWSCQDRPRGLNHVRTSRDRERHYREFRLDYIDGSKKLSSERAVLFPVVPG